MVDQKENQDEELENQESSNRLIGKLLALFVVVIIFLYFNS